MKFRNLIAGVFSALIFLNLSSCSADSDKNNLNEPDVTSEETSVIETTVATSEETTAVVTTTSVTTSEITTTESTKSQKFEVSIGDAYMDYDYNGDAFIAVCICLNNQSDETQSYGSNYRARAFQNGVECQENLADSRYNGDVYTQLRPGAEYSVYELFYLRDINADVEVEITDLWSDELVASKVFTYTP